MQNRQRRIVLAAGGSGGHLFPAQKLAEELLQTHSDTEILFIGSGLAANRFFEKHRFPFKEIVSATPFGRNLGAIFGAFWSLCKGVAGASRILTEFRPDLVIGFGSYHSFPVVCAARFKKIPVLLFESNAEPGKANRFFSRWAIATAVQFPEAAKHLKGKVVEVAMPLRKSSVKMSSLEARNYFSLEPKELTLLVFGGSQGASTINQGVCRAFSAMKKGGINFQVIHLAGNTKNAEAVRAVYTAEGIPHQVKEFERNMDLAWTAADLVICRCGASTIAEQIDFEVPGILIPYPYAYEHQSKNGLFMMQKVGGALMLKDRELEGDALRIAIEQLIDPRENKLTTMRSSIATFKQGRSLQTLAEIVRIAIQEKGASI